MRQGQMPPCVFAGSAAPHCTSHLKAGMPPLKSRALGTLPAAAAAAAAVRHSPPRPPGAQCWPFPLCRRCGAPLAPAAAPAPSPSWWAARRRTAGRAPARAGEGASPTGVRCRCRLCWEGRRPRPAAGVCSDQSKNAMASTTGAPAGGPHLPGQQAQGPTVGAALRCPQVLQRLVRLPAVGGALPGRARVVR